MDKDYSYLEAEAVAIVNEILGINVSYLSDCRLLYSMLTSFSRSPCSRTTTLSVELRATKTQTMTRKTLLPPTTRETSPLTTEPIPKRPTRAP
jgi:hypothetical protein